MLGTSSLEEVQKEFNPNTNQGPIRPNPNTNQPQYEPTPIHTDPNLNPNPNPNQVQKKAKGDAGAFAGGVSMTDIMSKARETTGAATLRPPAEGAAEGGGGDGAVTFLGL